LSFLPLSSLMVFFLLLILRLAKNKKETLAPIKKEVRTGDEQNSSLEDRD
jgi:preprotein translocase subunit YajC